MKVFEMDLRLLVVEGNASQAREAQRAAFGKTPSQSYADTLHELAPDAICDLCFPADEGAILPDSGGLESYDGVFATGSALNLYDGGPAVSRQIELARAVFAAQVPFFGSCWGLQVATAASGGEVRRNPLGREIGFARNIAPTEAGRGHPLLAGRPAAFDAPCSHLDIVALPSQGAVALAANANSPVQAAEIRYDGGIFWGVQYHPEFSFGEIAAIIEGRRARLTLEGLFAQEEDALAYGAQLRALEADLDRRDIAWRLGLGAELTDKALRRTELRNFIDLRVRPEKSRRGRH
jgi:GMP synthase (glutamine-hydrolysing)